jgi:hypothetical protein
MTAHRAAAGVTPWAPRPAAASGADHGNPAVTGGGLGGGLVGGAGRAGLPGAGLLGAVLAGEVAAAGMPFGAGDYGAGGYGMATSYWALGALHGLGGGAAGSTRPMTARPDTGRGSLVPETDDVSAVSVTGDCPAVLAFVLVLAAAALGPPLAGQVAHDEHWAAGLDELITSPA